ncbi:hypothetical protein Cgig2_007767 [Carnegiea gigantea]|uniref:Uncharacterized protein n=1 Tax=Carnegiea gigantea TaxID=171969 RepID=A0A9Q1JFM1_9CARY|nr:hypothetical protein Cgig2_007767 [Carnegiea gigantea]
MVKDLFLPLERRWDLPKLRKLFDYDTVDKSMKIPLPMNNVADKMIWTKEMEGRFIVKSAYLARVELIRVGEVDNTYKRIWSAPLTESIVASTSSSRSPSRPPFLQADNSTVKEEIPSNGSNRNGGRASIRIIQFKSHFFQAIRSQELHPDQLW